MKFDINSKSISFVDMAPLQRNAIFDFINVSIECAIEEFDPERFKKLEDFGSNLIQIFGGNGLKINIGDSD